MSWGLQTGNVKLECLGGHNRTALSQDVLGVADWQR